MIIIGTPGTRGAGYFVNNKETKQRQEADVQTCPHCQAVILMQEWKKTGYWCTREMKPLCDSCAPRAAIFGCEPFMKKLEAAMEAEMRFKKLIIKGP